MRDSMKITVRYQFLYILFVQAAVSGITLVFGFVAFWYFTSISIAKEILSILFIAAVNFSMLYTASKKFALLDNKPYTPLKPSVLKGALFGCPIAAVNLIFVAVYKLIWVKFGTDAGLSGAFPMIINAAFYYCTYPYNGLMNLSDGTLTVYSVVVMAIQPVAATIAGYIAGCKKFEFTEKIDKFIYEKE